MKKIYYILAIFIISVVFIAPISASDNPTDSLNYEISDLQSSNNGSFSDLSDLIQNTPKGETLQLTKNYKFDNNTDFNYKEGIELDFITIDGSGNSIDGSGQARIFNTFNNVTLKNLKLINGFGDKGGAIYSNTSVNCDNVVFENNSAKIIGGGIYAYYLSLNNCTFNTNYAANGSSIYLNNRVGEIDIPDSLINNSIFKNIDGNNIFINNTPKDIKINNSIFENALSQNGRAIFSQSAGAINIYNTKFRNLKSGNGAALLLFSTSAKIDKSEFINCSSSNNAGAILIDAYASFNYIQEMGVSLTVYNSNFVNCSAKFGGSIVQTGGRLLINESNFENNFVSNKGGAIYTSLLTSAIVENSTFKDNKANFTFGDYSPNGGAIYTLFNPVLINNSKFINNSNGAIYSNECDFNVTNCQFDNNIEAIHSYYPKSLSLTNNTLNNDILIENDTNMDYHLIISNKALEIKLVNNTINVENLPSRFDLRDWGWETSVKDQSITSGCWAFTAISALESNIRKATGLQYNASTRNMHRTMSAFSEYGNSVHPDGVNDTGTPIDYLVSWIGPIQYDIDPTDNYAKIDSLVWLDESLHIQDVMLIRGQKHNLTVDEIKRILIEYGAISSEYSFDPTPPNYNIKTFASYTNESVKGSHAMTLIGWDDNFSKSNFYRTPPGDGAWIYKNSYGSDKNYDDKGYIYVSYYDADVLADDSSFVVLFENIENYTTNYQTDFGGKLNLLNSTSDYSYKNTYQARGNELISAVGTYLNDENEEYTLEIYVNGELKLMQTGLAPFYGYHTIKLNQEIPVRTGDNFTAVMKAHSIPIIEDTRMNFKENISFADYGNGWVDLAKERKTTTLKVYTKDLVLYTEDLVKIYKNESKFLALTDCINETVCFEINGITYNRTTDDKGIARIAINLNPGNYTIKTTFNGTTVENNIEVLPTLIADNLVKYYKNESQFYISLIDGEGNPVSQVNITMNINGVFYNRLTNENGTAKLNINLEPGEYILTAADPLTGLQMSYSITVLPVLTGKDLEMSYKDGSKFEAKLVDGTGKALSGESITFNINGVFYNRTTDENGIARLNINLMAGEYIITSMYSNNARISNKITISS